MISTKVPKHVAPSQSRRTRDAVPCIHLGLPKTATTMLQEFLFAKHSGINALGKIPRAGQGRAYPTDATIQFNNHISGLRKPMPDTAVTEFRANVWTAAEEGRISVFSKEGLCGFPPENVEKFTTLLQELFGDCRILITLREPLSFTEALYFQHLKTYQMGKTRGLTKHLGQPPRYFDINQWLELAFSLRKPPVESMLRFGETASAYAKVFGKDRVKLLVYEQLKTDPQKFVRELSSFLEIDADEAIELSQNRSSNVRWSENPINRLKNLDCSSWQRFVYRLSPRRGRARMLGLKGVHDLSDGPKAKAQFDPSFENRILQIGREQSRIIESIWGISLAEFGYPV